ncbi:MAG: hypothetical protein ABFS19_10755 [Thermodesulfobacteriota bacterium]
MGKNQLMIGLAVVCLLGVLWGSVKDKQSKNLLKEIENLNVQLGQTQGGERVDPAAIARELNELRSGKKELLANVATLKGDMQSKVDEIGALKKKLESAPAVDPAAMEEAKAKLAGCQEDLGGAQENSVAMKAELEGANQGLAEAGALLNAAEEIKIQLANDLDALNQQTQTLATAAQEDGARITALEAALDKRTKALIRSGEELDRTKLNMNVLLSKIGGQQDSLKILEKTRLALEKELAAKFLLIEELESQLAKGDSVEAVIDEAPAQQ